MDQNFAKFLSVIFRDDLVVVTQNDDLHRPSLIITRSDKPEIYTEHVELSSGETYDKPVYAVLGLINLLSGPYLVVATDVVAKGAISLRARQPEGFVFQVKEVATLPIMKPALAPPLEKDENVFLDMVTSLLGAGDFYFSFDIDLSNSCQRSSKLSFESAQLPPAWAAIEDRFVWNSHLQAPFLPFVKDFGNFFPPIIQGFVQIKRTCEVNKAKFSYALISRRNKNRAGTRFNMRGADSSGNVANFVETEQIIQLADGRIFSGVQTRGSIPVVWTQEPTLDYEPKIQVKTAPSRAACQAHFDDQIKLYNRQVLVNLVKTKGSEKAIGSEYERQVAALDNPKLRYVGFDVYQHCGHSNYSKLSILVNQIQDDLHSQGYFSSGVDGSVQRTQDGVFRTNCKDCLDRTNLVQIVFAQLALIQQLRDAGILRSAAEFEKQQEFVQFFRSTWGDNGDAISTAYAGTPALKRDVTRTGKRTVQGIVDDGVNAVTRYYINNFRDGFRQDSMDLVLGNYTVNHQGHTSPFASSVESALLWLVLPLIAFLRFVAPRQVRALDLVLLVFWIGLAVLLGKLFKLRSHVIDYPRLGSRSKSVTVAPRPAKQE
eukprot:TRINITY_DN10124_c0_g1_i1.p1 TRINITY_DN10124_c0_g1~~TRINITY_DN10124_c0_g1_i1.p1  ORF type:complete len:600 (+),score=236.81 TRINITY_DN10124_c0_g1_i1:38-1837(+)